MPVTGCLHLKTACCRLDDEAVLANRNWFDAQAFSGYRILDVASDEPGAADVLPLDGAVLMPSSFPKTAEILAQAGFRPRGIDVSELQKAEAGVTCMSFGLKFTRGLPVSGAR